MFGSILAGIGSTLLGALFSNKSAKQQQSYNVVNMAQQNKYNTQEMRYANELNKDLAKYNQELTLENLAASPGALRKGMEYAGFNPILAYSQGSFSNASAPGSSQALGSSLPSAPNPDYAGAITNAAQFSLHARQQRNQDNITNAQINNTNADSNLKMELLRSEIAKQTNLKSLTMLNEIDKLIKDKDLEWYERKQLREDKKVLIEQQVADAQSTIARSSLQNAITNATEVGLKRDSNYYTESNQGVIGKNLHTVKNVFGEFLNISPAAKRQVYQLKNLGIGKYAKQKYLRIKQYLNSRRY